MIKPEKNGRYENAGLNIGQVDAAASRIRFEPTRRRHHVRWHGPAVLVKRVPPHLLGLTEQRALRQVLSVRQVEGMKIDRFYFWVAATAALSGLATIGWLVDAVAHPWPSLLSAASMGVTSAMFVRLVVVGRRSERAHLKRIAEIDATLARFRELER